MGGRLAPAAALAIAMALLAAVLLALHGRVLGYPFLSDDYLFLERVRQGLIESLRAAYGAPSYYFRPVGQELYFGALTAIGGRSALLFHVVDFAILLFAVLQVALLGRSFAGLRVGLLAAAWFALFHAHGVLLGYVSCAQDLIAIALGVTAVRFHAGGRRFAAAATFGLALLAKETVVVLPLVLAVWEAWPDAWRRMPAWRRAAQRTWMLWGVVLLWAALVPGARSLAHLGATLPGAGFSLHFAELWQGLWVTWRTYLAVEQPWADLSAAARSVRVGWWIVALVAAVAGVFHAAPAAVRGGAAPAPGERRRLLWLGVAWALVGALPVAVAAARFSAYYVGFAAVGFALVAGVVLSRAPLPATVLAFALAAFVSVAANGTQRFRMNVDDRRLPLGVSICTPARFRAEARYLDALHDALRRDPPPPGAEIWISQPFGYAVASTSLKYAPGVWFDDPEIRTRFLRYFDLDSPPKPRRYLRFDSEAWTFTSLPESLAIGMRRTDEAMLARDARTARTVIEQALRFAAPGVHDPERVGLYYNLGLSALWSGDTTATEVAWRKTVDLDPAYEDALLGLARLAGTQGRFGASRSWARRALAARPGSPGGLYLLAMSEVGLGNADEGRRLLRRLALEHPAFAESLAARPLPER